MQASDRDWCALLVRGSDSANFRVWYAVLTMNVSFGGGAHQAMRRGTYYTHAQSQDRESSSLELSIPIFFAKRLFTSKRRLVDRRAMDVGSFVQTRALQVRAVEKGHCRYIVNFLDLPCWTARHFGGRNISVSLSAATTQTVHRRSA